MNLHGILDQLDEIIYISDPDTYELLFLNRCARNKFGELKPGARCYEALQGAEQPCPFCTNETLKNCQGHRLTWVRQHPEVGSMLLHDSLIEYNGKRCRMEEAIDINRYITELNDTKLDLAAERKLVECIENLVVTKDFHAAVNSMLQTIIEHYDADRAYIFEFDWEKNVTHNTFEMCRAGVEPEIQNLQSVPIAVVAGWVDVFRNRQKKINIIEDVDALKDNPIRRIEYDCLHPQGIQSLITVPIFLEGELHGFLGVDNPRAHMDAPELLAQTTYIASNELQKRTLTERVMAQSRQDPLTGLCNRLAYDECLDCLQGQEVPMGVGFLDLNGLKWINDTLGHDYGNKAILRACQLMREFFDAGQIYRISGEEFVLLCPELGFGEFMERSKRLESALVMEKDLAALGYVWGKAEDATEMVRKAEQAMYAAKRKFYLREGTKTTGQRPAYLDALLQEYRDSTFVAYLQPLYSMQKGRVYGAEALVRKIDPRGNIQVPFEFIHMMEQERMISMVDFEMLRQVCRLLVEWKPVWPELTLHVNFSRITLADPDCLTHVDKVLAETGADPRQLVLEVTESSQGIQLESMASRLNALRERGITIALDDLGTEAACLEMLYLPQIEIAKIDRSLICKAENSRREQTVIYHLIDLCHDLGMTCVVEGIETEGQVELLKKLNCDLLQGYHIGKPMPVAEFFERFGPAPQA